MSLMDREFVPLSEVEIVEALASDANILVENQGEVCRATLGQIREVVQQGIKVESTGSTIRVFVNPTSFNEETIGAYIDEFGIVPLISYIEKTQINELVNKYKQGYSFELIMDETELAKEEIAEYLPGVEVLGLYTPMVFVYSNIGIVEKGEEKVFLLGGMIHEADFPFMYGWSTSEEFLREVLAFL